MDDRFLERMDEQLAGWSDPADDGYAQGFGVYQPQPIERVAGESPA